MRAKDFIPASKPRNFVAKNQKTGGAGAHKDKKKAEKQGYEKHKGKGVEESALKDKDDLQAKRKALQDIQMDPNTHKDPELKAALARRKADLEKEAKAKGMAEGRHGYDDAGFSLAPGHDEGEPVYNPRYDRTGQYDRKAKYSQDYNYNTGKPLGAPSERKGFIFYNVKDDQKASDLGLKRTRSGKWYVPTGDRLKQQVADKEFGKGRIWYPEN